MSPASSSSEDARRTDDVGASADAERAIPIVQEETFVDKRTIDTEHVRVTSSVDEQKVVVRDTVSRERVEIVRVPVEREVDGAPPIRQENGVTIIPVIEERLVVEKRLFLVEEIHVFRSAEDQPVELPTTLRRTRVDIDRTDLTNSEETLHGGS